MLHDSSIMRCTRTFYTCFRKMISMEYIFFFFWVIEPSGKNGMILIVRLNHIQYYEITAKRADWTLTYKACISIWWWWTVVHSRTSARHGSHNFIWGEHCCRSVFRFVFLRSSILFMWCNRSGVAFEFKWIAAVHIGAPCASMIKNVITWLIANENMCEWKSIRLKCTRVLSSSPRRKWISNAFELFDNNNINSRWFLRCDKSWVVSAPLHLNSPFKFL